MVFTQSIFFSRRHFRLWYFNSPFITFAVLCSFEIENLFVLFSFIISQFVFCFVEYPDLLYFPAKYSYYV